MQQIISVDSQMLSTFSSCAQQFKYRFVDNLRGGVKAEALEKGDLMHKLLEIAYPLKMGKYKDRDNFLELDREGIKLPMIINHDVIRNFCDVVSSFYARKMSFPEEEVRLIVHHFNEYWDYYQHDSWNPLAVEEVGSKVMFESDNLKIIYTFKIDMIAEKGNIIAPWDHKTSKRRSEPNSMSNQFIGYCYGLSTPEHSVNNILINKIGFQKTLSPKERFNRFILTIDDARIEEWRRNSIRWILEMKESAENGIWKMNFTSCDKFSDGCDYMRLCESSPDGRLYKIERDYKVEEQWDPAKKLETL